MATALNITLADREANPNGATTSNSKPARSSLSKASRSPKAETQREADGSVSTGASASGSTPRKDTHAHGHGHGHAHPYTHGGSQAGVVEIDLNTIGGSEKAAAAAMGINAMTGHKVASRMRPKSHSKTKGFVSYECCLVYTTQHTFAVSCIRRK